MKLRELNLLKTLYFNLKCLPFLQALKFPVLICRRVKINKLEGKNLLDKNAVKFGTIKIGQRMLGNIDFKNSRTVLEIYGTIMFKGRATIGQGSRLSIGKDGKLNVGDHFTITGGSTSIICNKEITFGNDCLLSWDILIMDTDFHSILNVDGIKTNEDKPIFIGNHVWIGCRNTILKGVKIGDNNVIAANSTITKSVKLENCIVGGNGYVLKENITWKS